MAPTTLIAAGIAMLPAIHSWWTGRKLIARTADPAFPELLLARSQQRGFVCAAAWALVVVLAGSEWMWAIPLLVIGQVAGGFPFRRALFGERWSIGEYLRFTLGSFAAGAGFWALLAFGPRVAVAVVEGWTPDRPVAVALAVAVGFAALLVAWDLSFQRVWLTLHRGSPLERADLQPRLEDIVRRAGLTRPPRLFRFGAAGSYMMNAVALPSTSRPGVAFGDTLLDLLDADEIAAVFAHEVAHLEHYDARRLARLRLLTWALIGGGIAVTVAPIGLVPRYASLITLAWTPIVLAVLFHRLSQSQKHEAESDRRSAELTGDPEPMVRALTKLHHYSKMPRRWPYDFERSATHPSLARRIQALRGPGQPARVRTMADDAAAATNATSVAGAALPAAATALAADPAGRRGGEQQPTILRSTKPGSFIVLDATRIYWLDGVTERGAQPTEARGEQPTEPAPAAASLAELQERATTFRATAYAELVELRVGVSGLARAIHVRDRGGKTSVTPLHPADVAAAQHALDQLDGLLATRGGRDWRRSARMIAALVALVSIGSTAFAWGWIPLLIALAAPSAWSLGAAGTFAAGRGVLTALEASGGGPLYLWLSAALGVIVGIAALVAAWRWSAGSDAGRRKRIGQTALAAAVSVAVVAMQGYRARIAPLEWTSAPAEVVTRFQTRGFGRGVRLSPAGSRIAVQTVDAASSRGAYDDDEDASWHFTVSDMGDSTGATSRSIDGFAMAFLDEDRVLALRAFAAHGDSLELVVQTLGPGSAALWTRVLPALAAPTLNVDRATGRWTVSGHDMETSEMVIVRGALDSTAIGMERSSYELLGGRALHAWADGSVLSASVDVPGGSPRMALASVGLLPFQWTLSRVHGGKRETIGTVPGVPQCTADGGTVVHCVVIGSRGTTLWRIDAAATLTLLGTLPREFELWRVAGANRIVAANSAAGTLAMVDAGSERGTLLTLPGSPGRERGFMMDAAAAPGLVAALTTDDGRSELTLYRVR